MSQPISTSTEGDYAWELATLFPAQGQWSEAAYLDLTDDSKRRIEFADGHLEFLPMPTLIHQLLSRYLFLALFQFAETQSLGQVHFSGIRLRIREGKIREPDIIFLHKDNFHALDNQVWDGADLVMEVVSGDPKDRKRDYEEKIADYAEGGVAEYWIVDYERKAVIVNQLVDGKYVANGTYSAEECASSLLLDGFTVDVAALFASADDVRE